MRKLVWLCGLFLAVSVPAMAQDEAPKIDLFGGYSYARFSVDTSKLAAPVGTLGLNANGGSGSAAFNANNWLGLVADFGGYKISQTVTVGGKKINVDTNVFSYMFGPRLSLRRGSVFPFAQVLVGGARLASSLRKANNPEEAFALTAGGGLDWKASRRFGIRLAQVEYFLTRFNDNNRNRQQNLRFSTGVIIYLGQR